MGPEVKVGKTYYFISTSTGKREGYRNLVGGLCAKYNLRLKVNVMSADRLKIESSETRKTFFEDQKKEKFDTKTVDEYQEKYVSEEINRNIAPQETSKSDPETDNTQ